MLRGEVMRWIYYTNRNRITPEMKAVEQYKHTCKVLDNDTL